MKMQHDQIYFTEVTEAETDANCGMKYWYSYLSGGNGITKKDLLIRNKIEAESLRDFRAIAEMEDISPVAIQAKIDDVLSPLTAVDKTDISKMELLYRRLGWLAAFALFIEPKIREEYETVKTDDNLLLCNDPLWVLTTPGRLLKHRINGYYLYREYVPMPAALTRQHWLDSWKYNIRLHAGITAAEESLKIRITSGQVVGMFMGYMSGADGRMAHPYVRAYFNATRKEWIHYLHPLGNNNAVGTWKPANVWDFPDGVVKWVQVCGSGIAESQFQASPPVSVNAQILNDWLAYRLHRGREIYNVVDECQKNAHVRRVHFPKCTHQCRPANSEACQYMDACWNPEVSPLAAGYIAKPAAPEPLNAVTVDVIAG
jgi:hypothetical protein